MEIRFTNYNYANNEKKKTSGNILYPVKTLLIHVLIFSIIALLICLFFSGNLYWTFLNVSNQLLLSVIFLFMGISHILFFPKWKKYVTELPLEFGIIYSVVFAFAIGLIVFLYFYIFSNSHLQLAITAAFSFLLPILIGISYTCFIAIDPVVEIEPWFLPLQKFTPNKRTNLPNSFQISFNLKIYYFDEVTADFNIIVAGGLRLGKVFHEFLLENNIADTKIQQLNYQLKPYGWLFFVKRFSGFKMLDPALTFFDNGIKENDIIIIDRVNIN